MIKTVLEFVGHWIGVTDQTALAVAQGIVLGGVVLGAFYMVLTLAVGLVVAILSER